MTITLPANVAPNELIQSAWGNSVVDALAELDNEKLNLAGGSLSGMVSLAITPTSASHLTRKQYVDDLVASVLAGPTTAFSGAVMFGKAAADLDVAGVEVYGTGATYLGAVRSTTATASIYNFYGRHMNAADGNAQSYAVFTRSSAGTVLGSISQVSTTGVAYNTTSGRELKTDRGPIGDALKMLAKRTPRLASFKGVAEAPVEMVFYADDWADVPGVTVGKPGAKITAALAKAREFGKVGDPDPMLMDYSRTTPLIAAAVLELADRIDRLEGAA